MFSFSLVSAVFGRRKFHIADTGGIQVRIQRHILFAEFGSTGSQLFVLLTQLVDLRQVLFNLSGQV